MFKPVEAYYILCLLASRLVGAYEPNGVARYNRFESCRRLLSVCADHRHSNQDRMELYRMYTLMVWAHQTSTVKCCNDPAMNTSCFLPA